MSQSPAPHAVRQAAAAQAEPDVITFELPPELLARLDEARGRLSRSDAVATVIVGLLRGTAEIVSTNKKPAPTPNHAPPAAPPEGTVTRPVPSVRVRTETHATQPHAEQVAGHSPVEPEAAAHRPAAPRRSEPAPPCAAAPIATDRQVADEPDDTGPGTGELDFAHEYFRMMDGNDDAPSLVVSRPKSTSHKSGKKPGARRGSGRRAASSKGEAAAHQGAERPRRSAGRLIGASAAGWRLSFDRRALATAGGLVLLGGGLLGSAVLNLQLIDENASVETASEQVVADRDALRRQVESSTAQSRDLMEKVELLERSLQTARADLRLLRGSRGDVAATLPPTPGAAPPPDSTRLGGSRAPATIPDDRPAANESGRPGSTAEAAAAGEQAPPLFRIEGMPRTEAVPRSPASSTASPSAQSAPAQPAPPAPAAGRPQAAALPTALPADRQTAPQPASATGALPAVPRPKPPVPESFQSPAPQEAAAAPARPAGSLGNAPTGIVIQGLPRSASPQFGTPTAGAGRAPQQVPQLVPRAVPVPQGRTATGAANGSTVIYGQPAPSVGNRQIPGMQSAVPAPPPTPRAAPPAVTPQQMQSGVSATRTPAGAAQSGAGGLASPGTAIGGADWSRFEMMADPAFGLRGQKNTQ